jgi:hypothetical protein
VGCLCFEYPREGEEADHETLDRWTEQEVVSIVYFLFIQPYLIIGDYEVDNMGMKSSSRECWAWAVVLRIPWAIAPLCGGIRAHFWELIRPLLLST